MNFRVKVLLQTVFSYVPYGIHMNYIMQRYVTRSLPISDEEFLNRLECSKAHLDAFAKTKKDISKSTYYEFGAGWVPDVPLAMWAAGFEKVIIIDRDPLMFSYIFKSLIKQFQKFEHKLPFEVKRSFKNIDMTGDVKDILKRMGIDYLAPCDASDTGLSSESVDMMGSRSTFEHLPRKDIHAIMKETRRILKNDGVVSMFIDYQDHYSYFDKRISVYNFLKYSRRVWALMNPPLQYQNRMRHSDYCYMFRINGFSILKDEYKEPTDVDIEKLANMDIHKNFNQDEYNKLDRAIRGAYIVLKKSS